MRKIWEIYITVIYLYMWVFVTYVYTPSRIRNSLLFVINHCGNTQFMDIYYHRRSGVYISDFIRLHLIPRISQAFFEYLNFFTALQLEFIIEFRAHLYIDILTSVHSSISVQILNVKTLHIVLLIGINIWHNMCHTYSCICLYMCCYVLCSYIRFLS